MPNPSLTIKFNNGNVVIDLYKSPLGYVRAPSRVEHGDWKTQSIRSWFMGLEKDETARILGFRNNFEGLWITVERADGYNVDCRANQLDHITEEEYLKGKQHVGATDLSPCG